MRPALPSGENGPRAVAAVNNGTLAEARTAGNQRGGETPHVQSFKSSEGDANVVPSGPSRPSCARVAPSSDHWATADPRPDPPVLASSTRYKRLNLVAVFRSGRVVLGGIARSNKYF